MKSVIYGLTAMLLISVVAWGVTGVMATSSGDLYSSDNNSVRLD
ncbi:MAG: hypothetical protein QNJ29_14215 [Rhizobiaceae bacterium]|nr:hypothetical protein [Rhizobiaceae bacterium]